MCVCVCVCLSLTIHYGALKLQLFQIMKLEIEEISALRSFVFLWCGSGEGLDLGRMVSLTLIRELYCLEGEWQCSKVGGDEKKQSGCTG